MVLVPYSYGTRRSDKVQYSYSYNITGTPVLVLVTNFVCSGVINVAYGTVLHSTSIRTSVVLVPGAGRTVLYCTTCRYDGSPHFRFGIRSVCVRYAFEIRSGCLSSCMPPCMRVGRTVLYCTTCKYGSPHFRTGCVRDLFAMHSVGVRRAFGMRSVCVRDACLPACLPACMQAVGTRTSTVLHTTSTVFVHQSYQG